MKRFKGFYPALDRALDIVSNDKIFGIVFTRRNDNFTTALIHHHRFEDDRESFEALCNYDFGEDFYKTETGRVAYLCVDLESIGTDFLRLYKNQPQNVPQGVDPEDYDDWVENIGLYIDTNTDKILGTKEYIRSQKDFCYKINYFDANMQMTAVDQREVLGEYEDWNGPTELVDIAKEEGVHYAFAKKVNKDSGYFIVHNKPLGHSRT